MAAISHMTSIYVGAWRALCKFERGSGEVQAGFWQVGVMGEFSYGLGVVLFP